MKKYIAILTFLAAMIACSKEDTESGGDQTPAAPTSITVTPESLSADRTGGAVTLTVTAPSRPKVTTTADWVTVSDGTYKDYKITFTLTVNPYGEYGSRETTLTVTAGSLSKSVSLTQQGREYVENNVDIDKSLVTTNPTDGAKKLYDFLLTNYGKKSVSSVMADVNWNTTIAQKVYQNTGKYPAMNCFDFIHIYVPANNWINYNDLKPVTDWHESGGIVSLMWHFNVPLSASTEVKTDGSGVTCSPDKTSFKACNALQDGTWENAWYKDQLAKVADIILQLQEQGIAAVWRPYHEAAGNSLALKWNGSAWFWWGADGAETFKALWNDMFDYFAERGIRNLVWVWTAQSNNGDASSYDSDTAWYPGDDRVDVVARDIYGWNAGGIAQDFLTLQHLYNHKMIVLGECGHGSGVEFPALSDIWAREGYFGWFMPWYESGATMVSWSWWKTAFASDFVLTREDISL